jgi:hypothetical protein
MNNIANAESLENYLRQQYDAFDKGRADDIDGGWYIGYGYRSIMPRADLDESMRIQFSEFFFSMMERYHIAIDELHVAIDGNIGLAWGFHTEDFQMKGRPPERLRIRFSMTLKFDNNKWQVIMGHRDIQPFDASGMYIPADLS